MRYFVTGATGFIGGRLVRQLRDDGHEVVALVRDPVAAAPLEDLGVELAPGDITDRSTLRAPMTGVDGVFHVAAWFKVGARDHTQAERINVGGTRNVLEMMAELAIPKGVYTSTIAVFSDTKGKLVDESYRYDGEHLSKYDRSKWLAHYTVAEPMMRAGLPLVIVQPSVVYGLGDTSTMGEVFTHYVQGRQPILPARADICWVHVDDVARGHILAMTRGKVGESYILAGPRHTMVEAFRIAEHITGVRAPRIIIPPTLLRLTAALARPLASLLPPTYHPESLRVVAGTSYIGDNAKARRELGFEPRSLEEGLAEALPALMRELGATGG